MAVGDVLTDAGISIPAISMGKVATWGMYFFGAMLFAVGLALFTYWYYMNIKFDKKIKLFRKVGSAILPVAIYKGMFARVGRAGDYWLVTRKIKKTLPRPKIQMNINEYWYYEREDGEWINFGLQDIDKVMKEAKVYYVDEDMRLQRLGIQKNLDDRFKKVTWWQQYGGMIVTAVFLLIVTICLVVIFREMGDGWSKAGEMAQAVEHMAKSIDNMATRVGSGVVPAPQGVS